jgi:hypothetical protein
MTMAERMSLYTLVGNDGTTRRRWRSREETALHWSLPIAQAGDRFIGRGGLTVATFATETLTDEAGTSVGIRTVLAERCEVCGEAGMPEDRVRFHVISPPVEGFRLEAVEAHDRCAAEEARALVT